MAKLIFNLDEIDLLNSARYDADSAAKLLLKVAAYIRNDENMPIYLKDYIAGAIETSMITAPPYRNKALLRQLNLLKSSGKPPTKANWYEVGSEMSRLMEDGLNKEAAISKIQHDSNETLNRSSLQRLYDEYVKKIDLNAILNNAENDAL